MSGKGPSVLREVFLRMDGIPRIPLDDGRRTVPVERVSRFSGATCLDFVNWQHSVFRMLGLRDHSYLIFYVTGDGRAVSHAWSVVEVGGQSWWFETSLDWNMGVHRVDSYLDVVQDIMGRCGPVSDVEVYEYDPEGLDRWLTPGEFARAVMGEGTRMEYQTSFDWE